MIYKDLDLQATKSNLRCHNYLLGLTKQVIMTLLFILMYSYNAIERK